MNEETKKILDRLAISFHMTHGENDTDVYTHATALNWCVELLKTSIKHNTLSEVTKFPRNILKDLFKAAADLCDLAHFGNCPESTAAELGRNYIFLKGLYEEETK